MEIGFSDIFLCLFPSLLPIALKDGKSAICVIQDAPDEGASFNDSVNSAGRPATKAPIP